MLIWAMPYLKYLQGMLGFKGVLVFLRRSVNAFCSNILTRCTTVVTGPTRREACGSICKALLDRGIVITGLVQTGILRTRQMSTQVNRRGLRSANNIQRA